MGCVRQAVADEKRALQGPSILHATAGPITGDPATASPAADGRAGGPQDAAVGDATPRQLLQRPSPRKRGSGLPSPVLKLAWQRMHTYIFELDIIGLTPGSAFGRAAVYSACVWRSLTPVVVVVAGEARRVAIDRGGSGA